jgi:peptidoglycan/LPS O-acetylase OafA/YrhL
LRAAQLIYRPDIDGLRAIAVLAVLIFHAFPDVLPSGFVGVDIFFVISGYLITSILLRQLAIGQFSIAHFYAQRIKRIFPALTLVLTFCLCVGWVALTSGEYRQLGRYTAGGAAFLNNFLFWKDAGYFDTAAVTKPLLHLWSLAIEEQFYLLWPILLWLAHKMSDKARAKAVLILILLASSLWWSYHLIARQTSADLTADFYSPLSRAWELALGALLAHINQRRAEQAMHERTSNFFAAAGGILLIASFALIDHNSAFPGLWALLPTLGAASLIAAGSPSKLNQYVLASRPLVWIGLISYPLYLWHWPLLTFARIFDGQTPTALTRATLLVASLVLAWLTYRLIERPIRASATAQRTSILIVRALCIVMIMLFAAGYAVTRNDGLPSRHYDRFNADMHSIQLGADRGLLKRECGLEPAQAAIFEWCISQNKTAPVRFALLGDSKGEALYYGLAREAAPDENWLLLGSFPTFKLSAYNPLLEKAISQIEKNTQIKIVVLASSYRHIFPTDHINGFIEKSYNASDIELAVEAQDDVVRRLQRAGKQVTFVVDNPTLPDPSSCIEGEMTTLPILKHLLTRAANPNCRMSYKDHLKGTTPYQQFIHLLAAKNKDLRVFNPTPLMCDIASDTCTYLENRQFLYSYGDHISDYANSKIATQLLPLLRLR